MRVKFGISAALVTPFDTDGSVNHVKMLDHANRTLGRGADGITLFGTTGEGASISPLERLAIMNSFQASGFDMARVTMAVYASAMGEALAQAEAAHAKGIKRILLLPPFYFKGVSDAALRHWFKQVLAGLPSGLEVIIYHIPQITLVPISPALVHDLQRTYPHQVVAVKDSSGDWDNTVQLLENPDLAVLIGDERHLAKAAPLGCAGAISGMANLFPQRLKQILASGQRDAELFDLVDAVVTQPVTPAIKAIVGQMYGDESWQRVRAPLEQTPQAALLALSKLLSPMLSETVR